jgi:hypothetical protein
MTTKCDSCKDGEVYDVDAEFIVRFVGDFGRQKTMRVCEGHSELLYEDYEVVSCTKIKG